MDTRAKPYHSEIDLLPINNVPHIEYLALVYFMFPTPYSGAGEEAKEPQTNKSRLDLVRVCLFLMLT